MRTMKVLVVLSFDIENALPDEIAKIIKAINPPDLPHFSGQARIVIDPEATTIEKWLDE